MKSKKQINKRKKITIDKYMKIMDDITKLGKPVSDTLIAMLDEACKYEIIGFNVKKNKRH